MCRYRAAEDAVSAAWGSLGKAAAVSSQFRNRRQGLMFADVLQVRDWNDFNSSHVPAMEEGTGEGALLYFKQVLVCGGSPAS